MSQEQKADEQAKREKAAQVESQEVFKGKKFSVRVDTITDRPGHTYRREIVVHPGAVVMLPVTKEGKLVLVRQWRRATGKVLLELPAGTLDEGEEPLTTAGRELQEEIGYKANRITPLGGFFSAPGILTEYLHLYLAEDLQESQLDPDENEELDICEMTLEEALAAVEKGEIEDAKSIVGLSRYYFRLQRPQS
jgi:ADP-ribose pyrophosphatase